MIPFFVLLFVPIFMQHFVVGTKKTDFKKKNRAALAFFFVFLTALIMLRHRNIGNDTGNYINIFRYISGLDWRAVAEYSVELGFSYFNKIVSIFTKNPQVFLAITALLTVGMIYPTYRRLCTDSSLTIVLFCTMSTFVMMFSGIRQMLAVGLGVVAYECARNKKLILFILVVILSVTVHVSAFMLMFIYPLYHIRITKKWLIAIVPLMAVVFIFNAQIFSALTEILRRFTQYDTEITSTGAFTILLLFLMFTVFAFLIPDESCLDTETLGLRNFLLFSLFLQMFAPLHMLAMRMNYYYIIFIPLLMPKIVACSSKKWEQFSIVGRHVMVVFFLVYFFWSAKDGGGLHVFPYHFFWEVV